jgi:SAM-dependent methyltransferase/methylase of polypeptide subunit release factors
MNGPGVRVILKRFISLAVCFAFVSAEAAQAHATAAGPSGHVTAAATAVTRQAFPVDLGQARLPVTHVSVQSVHPGRSNVTILHVQDAHSNLSGQKSLAAALDELMTRYPVELVLVEGGSGDVTLDRLKLVGTREQWSRAAGRLLYEGLIAGEEYLNLTSDHVMRLEGIEEKALYRQSLKVYDTIVRHRKETLPYLRRIALALDRVKNRVYPQALLDHEAALAASAGTGAGAQGERDAADFSVRTEKLLELARATGTDLGGFSAVRELMLLKTAEKRIDFERAQAEEEALMTAAYPDRGSEAFKAYTEARRKARVSPTAQLALLNDLLERSGRPRESLMMLGAYLKYLEDFSKIDMSALLLEMELLEDTVYRDVLKDNEDARMLRACDRFLGLLQKAYRIRMSSDEFRMLKVNESDFPTPLILGFLNRQLSDLGYDEDLTPYETPLEDARYAIELFYRLVDKRDRAFIANAKSAIAARGAKTAVLITGGYHTAHLEKLMRAEDWSYAVLTPMVEYETDQAKYEALLLAPLKVARRKLATVNAADRSGTAGGSDELQVASGRAKVRDGLRAQAAAARLSAVSDPAAVRVIQGVFGKDSNRIFLNASAAAPAVAVVRSEDVSGARMTASPTADAGLRARPQADGFRRAFVRAQNWFYRNGTLALTSSILALSTSYLFPRALYWLTFGFLALSMGASVYLAKRLRTARHAELMSGMNVIFQSLMVALVLYAGSGWKAGIDRAVQQTRELFAKAPAAETVIAAAVATTPIIDTVEVPVTAPAPSLPETVLERARQASDLVLPKHVETFNRAFVPLMSEVLVSETALDGDTRNALQTAVTMVATSRIETGKGYGGPDGADMLEQGAAGRASGAWQMNGATAKWVIANLIAQPDVYLKPFIDGSSDPEGMRTGILRLREAYRDPLFDMFGVDLGLGEDGWKQVAKAANALTDNQMRDLLARGDAAKPLFDAADRYRVQFVTARVLMLFKSVRDAKSYMEFYNTSVQADPAFKGLTSWTKAETFFAHAQLVLESAFEAYGSGSELDTTKLSELESRLALLEQAADGVGQVLYDMTRLLKLSVQDPESEQAPKLIKSIRDNVFKFRVQFGSLSEQGFGVLMNEFVESVQRDLSIIETRLIKAGVGVSRSDLPESVLRRMDSALVEIGGTSTASSLAYRASDDGRHTFVLHPALEALAREWMEGKGDWANVPLAALAELTPRDTEAITEPGFTPLLSWMVLTRLNQRSEQFPGQPFRMHWVDPKAHYGKAKEFYASVLATFKQIYPERNFPAPDEVAKPADAGFFETHTNIEGERRPMTITGPKAGQMVALNAADKPVPWRHLYLTREIGAGFLEITSLKRGMEVDPASFNQLVDEVALMFEQQGIGKDGRPVPIQQLVHRATPAAGTAADQLPGIRLASVSRTPAAPEGARMTRQYEVLSRNALYAPGDAVWADLYEDRVEFLDELFEANRPEYLRKRAAVIRQAEQNLSRARTEYPTDAGRISRLTDRAFMRLKDAFIGSVPNESGERRSREFVSAEDILAEEMSGWDDVSPRELLEASRLLHQIMSGLDQSYFYANPWFEVRLIRAVPASESRWVRRAVRIRDRFLSVFHQAFPPSVPDRLTVYRNLEFAVRDLKLAAAGDAEFEKALRASGLLMLLGPNAAAARRGMTAAGYSAALRALLENTEPDEVQSRGIRNVLKALEGFKTLRITSDRASMLQMDPADGHAGEVAQIQRFVDGLEYIAPVSDHRAGKLEYKNPEGMVVELAHLGSGVYNDVFDWNADYIVRVTRFQQLDQQFEDPELIRGAVAGVDGTGLTPRVIFFGQLSDGRSVQIIERMTETLDKHLTAASRYNTQDEVRAVVSALDRFAVRAVETGYALEDAHTGNFMLTERFGRIEVVYSDIDGLQRIGTSPGSQFQVALHFRGQLLGYPSFNPWAHRAKTLGRPLLRRLNLMIGGYQADRLADRIVNQSDLAGISGAQRAELESIQTMIGAAPLRSARTYDWENSFKRYMPSAPGNPGVPVPVTAEDIQEDYLETVKRVNDFYQKWPKTEETRWIADLLLLRAQWTRAMRMAHYQYENRWAKTSLDKMIESYEGRQDIRPSGWWKPFLKIGWFRWTAAAVADAAVGTATWLALGGSEGVYQLVQENPLLAAAVGVSTVLGLTGTVMLIIRPDMKRPDTVSGARMGMADLEVHFKALTGLEYHKMSHGIDLYPGPYAHQIEQSLNFAFQVVEWLEQVRSSGQLPEDRELRLADWGVGNGVLSMALAKWAQDHHIRVRITAVDTDPRAILTASENMRRIDEGFSGNFDFRTVLLSRGGDGRSTEVAGDFDLIFVNTPDVTSAPPGSGSNDTVKTDRGNFDRMIRSAAASLGYSGVMFIESNLRPGPEMFGNDTSMRILPLYPEDRHKRKVWMGVRSRLIDTARQLSDPRNVKSSFASHEEDPAKVWSWMTEDGRRAYLKWLPSDPNHAHETALGPDEDYLNDAMAMLLREGALLRKIYLEPRFETVRGYFSPLVDRGRISAEEAALLQGDGGNGVPVPEGAQFILTSEIPGVPLSEWIKTHKTPGEIEEFMRVLSSSVRTIHEAGIFHGDLGPSEIFIQETPDGRMLLRFADLGLAVLRGDVHLGLTDMMSRRGLLTLANEEFNADAARWVLALHQRDPWRARDLASLTNLYLFMIDQAGFEASKQETIAWIHGLLDPEGSGVYAAAIDDYLRALDAGNGSADVGTDTETEAADAGARMASGARGAWFWTLVKIMVPITVFALAYLTFSQFMGQKMETFQSEAQRARQAALAASVAGSEVAQEPMITEIPEAEVSPDEAERLLAALEKRVGGGTREIFSSTGEMRAKIYFIQLLVDSLTGWQDRLASLSATPEWAPEIDRRIDESIALARSLLAEVDRELTAAGEVSTKHASVAGLDSWEQLLQEAELLRVSHPKGIRSITVSSPVWSRLLDIRDRMQLMTQKAYEYEADDRSLFASATAQEMEQSLADLDEQLSLTDFEYAQLVVHTQERSKSHAAYGAGPSGEFVMDEQLKQNIRIWMAGGFRNVGDPHFYEVLRWSGLQKMEREIAPALWAVIRHLVAEEGSLKASIVDIWPAGASPLTMYASADRSAGVLLKEKKHILRVEMHLDYEKYPAGEEAGDLLNGDKSIRKAGSYGFDNPVGGRPNLAFYKRGNYWEMMTTDAAITLRPGDLVHLKREYPKLIAEWISAMAKYRELDPSEVGVAVALPIHTLYSEGDGVDAEDKAGLIAAADQQRTTERTARFMEGMSTRALLARADAFGTSPSAELAALLSQKKVGSKRMGEIVAKLGADLDRAKKKGGLSAEKAALMDKSYRAVRSYQSAYEFAAAYLKFIGTDAGSLNQKAHEMALTYLMAAMAETQLDPSVYGNAASPGPAQTGYGSWKDALTSARKTVAGKDGRSEFQSGLIAQNPDRVRLEKMHEFLLKGAPGGKIGAKLKEFAKLAAEDKDHSGSFHALLSGSSDGIAGAEQAGPAVFFTIMMQKSMGGLSWTEHPLREYHADFNTSTWQTWEEVAAVIDRTPEGLEADLKGVRVLDGGAVGPRTEAALVGAMETAMEAVLNGADLEALADGMKRSIEQMDSSGDMVRLFHDGPGKRILKAIAGPDASRKISLSDWRAFLEAQKKVEARVPSDDLGAYAGTLRSLRTVADYLESRSLVPSSKPAPSVASIRLPQGARMADRPDAVDEYWRGMWNESTRMFAGARPEEIELTIIDWMRSLPAPPRTVVDLGAGPEAVTLAKVQQAFPKARLIAVEPNAPERTADPLKLKIRRIRSDAAKTPLRANSADVVISVYGAMDYGDRDKVTAEMMRILRPGGRAVLMLHHPESFIIRTLDRAVGAGNKPADALDVVNHRYLKSQLFSDLKSVVTHFKQAGFNVLKIDEFEVRVETPIGYLVVLEKPGAADRTVLEMQSALEELMAAHRARLGRGSEGARMSMTSAEEITRHLKGWADGGVRKGVGILRFKPGTLEYAGTFQPYSGLDRQPTGGHSAMRAQLEAEYPDHTGETVSIDLEFKSGQLSEVRIIPYVMPGSKTRVEPARAEAIHEMVWEMLRTLPISDAQTHVWISRGMYGRLAGGYQSAVSIEALRLLKVSPSWELDFRLEVWMKGKKWSVKEAAKVLYELTAAFGRYPTHGTKLEDIVRSITEGYSQGSLSFRELRVEMDKITHRHDGILEGMSGPARMIVAEWEADRMSGFEAAWRLAHEFVSLEADPAAQRNIAEYSDGMPALRNTFAYYASAKGAKAMADPAMNLYESGSAIELGSRIHLRPSFSLALLAQAEIASSGVLLGIRRESDAHIFWLTDAVDLVEKGAFQKGERVILTALSTNEAVADKRIQRLAVHLMNDQDDDRSQIDSLPADRSIPGTVRVRQAYWTAAGARLSAKALEDPAVVRLGDFYSLGRTVRTVQVPVMPSGTFFFLSPDGLVGFSAADLGRAKVLSSTGRTVPSPVTAVLDTPRIPVASVPADLTDPQVQQMSRRIAERFMAAASEGRVPSFVTVLAGSAVSSAHRAEAEQMGARLASMFGAAPDAFPVIIESEADGEAYRGRRKVFVRLQGEAEALLSGLPSGTAGQGLSVIGADASGSVATAMLFQAVMGAAGVGEAVEAGRSVKGPLEFYGMFLKGVFGSVPSETGLEAMWSLNDVSALPEVLKLPIAGKTLGARLAEAMLAVIETGRSA